MPKYSRKHYAGKSRKYKGGYSGMMGYNGMGMGYNGMGYNGMGMPYNGYGYKGGKKYAYKKYGGKTRKYYKGGEYLRYM
jgi:hypothetical protein